MRSVSAHLEADIHGTADIVLLVSAAVTGTATISEELDLRIDDVPVPVTALYGPHGTRVHTLTAAPGRLTVRYRADIPTPATDLDADGPTVADASGAQPGPFAFINPGNPAVAASDPLDVVTYRLPSRYVESDTLVGLATSELRGLTGTDLLHGARDWVAERFTYVPGSTRFSDSVRDVLLSRRGVCRDYAHVLAGLLRAVDVPARLVSVYAPGLVPMDFHAVVEAYHEGHWYVLDATGLAPRAMLVRIATGRDAADTAFMSTYGGGVTLRTLRVTASSDDDAVDDGTASGDHQAADDPHALVLLP